MNKKAAGVFLTVLGGASWGLSGSMGQYLFQYEGMDSRWLVPIRLSLSGIILLIWCFVRYGKFTFDPWKRRRTAALLLAYSLPGIALCQFLYFLTIQLSSAGMGTILQDLSPVMILLVSCLAQKKMPSGLQIASIVLALSGVFLLVTHGNLHTLQVSPQALTAGVLCAATVTVYNMLAAPLQVKYPVTLMQGWAFLLGGGLMMLIFRPWTVAYVPSAMGVFGIFFVVAVGNLIAFSAYIKGIGYIGPEKGILYGFSEPVTAAVVSTMFLGSSFTLWDLCGFILIFLMMVMISLDARNKKKELYQKPEHS